MGLVNWTFEGNPITDYSQMPKGTIGIIYRIDNLTTKKYYIGRKTVASLKSRKLTKKEKLLPENKGKTIKKVFKSYSTWKSYVGSNDLLKDEIKKGHKYKKRILRYCFSKTEITYFETKEIVCSGCMEDDNCYNDWFSARVYKRNLKLNETN